MKKILGMLRSNLALKISALIFAMIMWAYVITISDAYRVKKLDQIPINYNIQLLSDKGLLLRGNRSEVFQPVEVELRVPISEYDNVGRSNITIEADLSAISEPGEHEITLKASRVSNGSVVAIKPGTVNLVVDEVGSDDLWVDYEFTGELPEGLIHDAPSFSPSNVTITGPKADVERVHKAICVIDLSQITESLTYENYAVKIVDSEGVEIPRSLLVNKPTTSVSMAVWHTKTVKLSYGLSSLQNLDKLPAGYVVEDVKLTQDEVVIAGNAEALENIETLNIKQIDVQGINVDSPAQLAVELELPDGVKPANNIQVKAILTISPPEAEEEEDPQGTESIKTFGVDGR